MRIAVALLLLMVCVGCGGSSSPAADPDTTSPAPVIQGVQTYSITDKHHFTKGEYPHTYPQSPPVGGPHPAAWLACGAYDQPVPSANAVHSLEHGAVWVTYSPGFKDAKALDDLVRLNPEYVLVSPYPGQDSPVVVTAWGLQLDLQSASDPRLVQFVQAYAGGGQGGEKGATCATNGLPPPQAQQYDDTLR